MDRVLKYFKTSWLLFNATPYVIYTSPKIFARDVNRKPTIVVEIVDYLNGIDLSTISFFVNSYDVMDASVVTSINGGFRISYTPLFSFYWGSDVNIRIRAANNKRYYMSDYEYYFTVTSRKINTMVEEAVLELAKNVDWGELE